MVSEIAEHIPQLSVIRNTVAIPRNHHIQALRGVAVSLVILDHALGALVEHGILPHWVDPVRYSIGGLGVYTFFVISGFIMINMSYNHFGYLAKSISFAERRIVRIVPTYWIGTLLAFALFTILPLQQHPTVINLIESLTFIPYSTSPTIDMVPILGQGWTLNYEMFFYALFTIALLFPRRIGLPALFVSFVGIVVAGTWFKSFSDVSPATTIPAFLSDPMILLFAAGMAIGVFKEKFRGISFICPFQIAAIVIALHILALVISRTPPRIPFPLTIATWVPGIIAVAVCALATPTRHNSWFANLSEILGDASYSTYIFHIFFLFALSKVFPVTTWLAVPYVLTALVGANLIGIAFTQIVERPMTKFFRAILTKFSLSTRV